MLSVWKKILQLPYAFGPHTSIVIEIFELGPTLSIFQGPLVTTLPSVSCLRFVLVSRVGTARVVFYENSTLKIERDASWHAAEYSDDANEARSAN